MAQRTGSLRSAGRAPSCLETCARSRRKWWMVGFEKRSPWMKFIFGQGSPAPTYHQQRQEGKVWLVKLQACFGKWCELGSCCKDELPLMLRLSTWLRMWPAWTKGNVKQSPSTWRSFHTGWTAAMRHRWTDQDCVGARGDRGLFRGLEFAEQSHWTEVRAVAAYPDEQQWLSEGAEWPGGRWGTVFPTAMKAIPRKRPPERPAGINRCDYDTIERWKADQYRFPPYHYMEQYVIWVNNRWRLTNSAERERLLGYGEGHTKVCMSASDIKRSKQPMRMSGCHSWGIPSASSPS